MNIETLFEKMNLNEINEAIGILESIKSERSAQALPQKVENTKTTQRVKNMLRSNNIVVWYQLADFSEKQVSRFREIGEKSLVEIKKQMKLRNIKFAKIPNDDYKI